jgi:hypothetical protein
MWMQRLDKLTLYFVLVVLGYLLGTAQTLLQ